MSSSSASHLPGDGPGSAIHESKALVMAWISVVLMIVGFGLVTLGLPVHSARVALWISGGVIGVIGIALGAAGKIMENVE